MKVMNSTLGTILTALLLAPRAAMRAADLPLPLVPAEGSVTYAEPPSTPWPVRGGRGLAEKANAYQ